MSCRMDKPVSELLALQKIGLEVDSLVKNIAQIVLDYEDSQTIPLSIETTNELKRFLRKARIKELENV